MDDPQADRPRLVLCPTQSVDGRVALARDRPLLFEPDAQLWRELESAPGARALLAEREALLSERYRPEVVLEGSGTFVAGNAAPTVGPRPAGGDEAQDGDEEELRTDFLPGEVTAHPAHRSWFAVVDGRGRVPWTVKGGGGVDLLVLVARATPSGYLRSLRAEGICYLVAGQERVDLGLALRRLRERLGVRCVVSKAGGGLNGALLRAGLVDELHLVVVPALVGGFGTPSVVDGTPLEPGAAPTRLILRSSRTSDDGALWLHYELPSA